MRSYFLVLGTLVALCVGCQSGGGRPLVDSNMYHAPPAEQLMRPGPMVDGPGPGVLAAAAFAPRPSTFASQKTQIRFLGPDGMSIGWQIAGGFADNQLTAMENKKFRQGASYRLKLSNLPDRPGMTVYPTMMVYPANPATDGYLAHVSIPVQITDGDLDQVDSNNYVTKVIYLPDPENQEEAIRGFEMLVSTQLSPTIDPVAKADSLGSILVVLRMGNVDLEQGTGSPVARGGDLQNVSHVQQVDGEQDQYVEPIPTGFINGAGKPMPMMMGAPRGGGMPAYSPIGGMGNAPVWGTPMSGTPIGLAGTARLPLGRPAGLRSVTRRNKTKRHIPKPVRDLVIDVEHQPGINMPDPVNHIEYTERHFGAGATPVQRQHRSYQIQHKTVLDGNR